MAVNATVPSDVSFTIAMQIQFAVVVAVVPRTHLNLIQISAVNSVLISFQLSLIMYVTEM